MSTNDKPKNILRLSVKNVGALSNFTFTDKEDLSKKRFCIYANNGSGKTMLSRCFNLPYVQANDPSNLRAIYPHIINLKQTSFSFEFALSLETDSTKKLCISGDKFSNIKITNNTGFFFYVFNEDYVKNNIREKHYQLDSNIEGYIIGSAAINLDAQDKNLELLSKSKEELIEKIKNEIDKVLEKISYFDVSKNTTEYKYIDFQNLRLNKKFNDVKQSDIYIAQHNKLKQFPDNATTVSDADFFQIDDYDSIIKIAAEEYSISSFSESFKESILPKLSFVRTGIELSNNLTCPFCGQAYDRNALELIDTYTKFLNDSQTQIITKLNSAISSLEEIKERYDKYLIKTANIDNCYNKYIEFFPSQKDFSLYQYQDIDALKNIIDTTIKKLKQKTENIGISIDISSDIKTLKKFIAKNSETRDKNNNLIKAINKLILSSAQEKLSIKRNLCKSIFNELWDETRADFDSLKNIENQISVVKSEIVKLQSSSQIVKKDIISETMAELLKAFFGNKYEFDRSNFHFKLLDCNVTDNLDYVLSEAEKNIIAFCFYIASVYQIVETKEGLKNVFYIIDDPVSSMDFTYVYTVAQIINNYCKKKNNTNILMLTHNLEFFNIVMKNGLMDAGFTIANGELKKISKNILMPYENHLRDIYKIATKESSPSHTTPNSIRHIVETINKFKSPQQKLEEFIISEEILSSNSPILKIIHSFSHGEIREEESYTDDMIIDACSAVVNYINANFPGQIERIKHES